MIERRKMSRKNLEKELILFSVLLFIVLSLASCKQMYRGDGDPCDNYPMEQCASEGIPPRELVFNDTFPKNNLTVYVDCKDPAIDCVGWNEDLEASGAQFCVDPAHEGSVQRCDAQPRESFDSFLNRTMNLTQVSDEDQMYLGYYQEEVLASLRTKIIPKDTTAILVLTCGLNPCNLTGYNQSELIDMYNTMVMEEWYADFVIRLNANKTPLMPIPWMVRVNGTHCTYRRTYPNDKEELPCPTSQFVGGGYFDE